MNYRIIRGSSCVSLLRNVRSARRIDFDPDLRCVYFGLRLALNAVQPPHIILRGGSWFLNKPRARSAVHASIKSSYRNGDTGLRLGLDLGQSSRAIRGGSWVDNKCLARSAYRYFRYPEGRYSSTGIRLALDSGIWIDSQQENIQ